MGFEFKIFQALEGQWNIKRVMHSYGAQFGTLEGIAKFSRKIDNECQYDYEEQGTLDRGGKVFSASKKYVYQFDNQAITVFYDEKPLRLFHNLVFANQMKATACHLCHEDTYEATYEFKDESSFTLKYKITGPKKDDLIETIFTKNLG